MTGRYIAKERLDIPDDLATLAESFQRAGWATGGFVSNPLITAQNGFARGFERFERIDEYGSNEAVARWFSDVAARRSFTYIDITEPHDPYLAPEGQREHRQRADLLPGDRAQFYERIGRERSSPTRRRRRAIKVERVATSTTCATRMRVAASQ